MTVRVFGIANGATAEDHRLALSLFMTPTGVGVLDRRAGIVPSPGAADLTAVAPMVGRVAPFVAWVDGTSASLQGGYPVVSDTPEDLTFDAGEAGVNRIDRVVCQVQDNSYDASGAQQGQVRIVKGQPTGAASALPVSSLLLWEVTVPAGASVGGGGFPISSARVDRRTYTAGLGGLLSVRDQSDRDTLTPYEGLRIYRLDASDPQIYSAGAWQWDAPPSVIRKTADQTITNQTALQNVTDLVLPVRANAVYSVDLRLFYTTPDAQDLVIGWSIPSGAAMRWSPMGVGAAVAANTGEILVQSRTGAETAVLGGGGGLTVMARPTGTLITSSTAGTLQLQFAQATAAATNTIIRAHSTLSITRSR